MGNVNKVIMIGRLTRDPECRAFSNGGKVAAFGFAVTNRRKNAQTGQWEDEPMFLDCKAFNRGDFGKLADTVEQYLRKGALTYVEGKLHLESWDDKNTGQKRSKHVLYVDNVQFLESRADAAARGAAGPRPSQAGPPSDSYNSSPDMGGGEDISNGAPVTGDAGPDGVPF